MVNKIVSILLLLSLLVVGSWCLVFKAYYETSDEVASRLSLGDWPGALGCLESYRKNPLSYPICKVPRLKGYLLRLNYMEGVVFNQMGNYEAATSFFQKAAESRETAVAAAAKYNLAYYAMKENGLDKARSLLNEALTLNPDGVEAKTNLELILKKIQARQRMDLPEKSERKESIRPQATPGEQWRLEVPDEESEGSGASSGQSFL